MGEYGKHSQIENVERKSEIKPLPIFEFDPKAPQESKFTFTYQGETFNIEVTPTIKSSGEAYSIYIEPEQAPQDQVIQADSQKVETKLPSYIEVHLGFRNIVINRPSVMRGDPPVYDVELTDYIKKTDTTNSLPSGLGQAFHERVFDSLQQWSEHRQKGFTHKCIRELSGFINSDTTDLDKNSWDKVFLPILKKHLYVRQEDTERRTVWTKRYEPNEKAA